MDNVPAEGTPAGDTLAVMVGLAPVVAIILAATIKPKWLAFIFAILASGGVIVAGVTYALDNAQGEGTEQAVAIFATVASSMSLFMATATAGGRALLARSKPLEQG